MPTRLAFAAALRSRCARTSCSLLSLLVASIQRSSVSVTHTRRQSSSTPESFSNSGTGERPPATTRLAPPRSRKPCSSDATMSAASASVSAAASAKRRTRVSNLAVPGIAIPSYQGACGRRTPTAGGVTLGTLVGLHPGLALRIDPAPCRVELVAAHEQREIALDDIGQQSLIGMQLRRLYALCHVQPQIHRTQAHGLAGILRQDGERDRITRLQRDDQPVGAGGRGALEDRKRHVFEVDHDVGDLLLQALAGAQIERHSGPAPGIDVRLDGDKGLRGAVGRDAVLIEIAHDRHALDRASTVLAAN